MEPYEYKGYTIRPNVHAADEPNADKWVFEAATILDAHGHEIHVAAPAGADHLFDTAEDAARVCISQAKALIEAGEVEEH